MNREIMQQALDALLNAQKQLTLEFTEPYIYQKEIAELEAELAKPEQASNEPPDYVEPPTSDYHNGWEEGFEAAKNLFKGKNT